MAAPARGDVWLADLDPSRGHDQGGKRPSPDPPLALTPCRQSRLPNASSFGAIVSILNVP